VELVSSVACAVRAGSSLPLVAASLCCFRAGPEAGLRRVVLPLLLSVLSRFEFDR
jgi:hypothetical protein